MLNARTLKNYKKSLKLQLREYVHNNMGFSLKEDLKTMLKRQSEYIGKNGEFNLDRLWFQHTRGYHSNNLYGEHEVSYLKSSSELKKYIRDFFIKRGFTVKETNKAYGEPFVESKSNLRLMLRVTIPSDKI